MFSRSKTVVSGRDPHGLVPPAQRWTTKLLSLTIEFDSVFLYLDAIYTRYAGGGVR